MKTMSIYSGAKYMKLKLKLKLPLICTITVPETNLDKQCVITSLANVT